MAAVCTLMPRYSIDSGQCQVDGGWDGSAGAVAEFDDWPIVLAVDLACTGMNRKSMAALERGSAPFQVKGAVRKRRLSS